jgi:uncharacterized protein involved in type VI secretion and phage assembly
MANTNGVVIGLVKSLEDPENLGRIQVTFPWLSGDNESRWARVATLMAGGDRGSWFMPEIDDEALVAFDHGDIQSPYIIGFLWNGPDRPPSEQPRERMLRSLNGHTIRFLDSTPDAGDRGALIIEDAHGNRIILSNSKITIRSTAVLELNAPVITLQGPGYRRVVSPNNNPL